MMRKILLGLIVLVSLVATGCASRDSVAAHQNPQPLDYQIAMASPSNSFYQQMALGPVLGTSQFSWFLPEPNRSILRPRFEAALDAAGLAAPNRDLARYVIELELTDVRGPSFGSHMDAALIGYVRIHDRMTGRWALNEPVYAYEEAYWPGISEAQWANGGYLGVFNIFPFFFDSPWLSVGPRKDTVYPPYSGPEWVPLVPIRMRRTDNTLQIGPSGQTYGAWSGAERAWQVNALVSDALAAAVMQAMVGRGLIDPVHVLPCGGSADIRERQHAYIMRGERVARAGCETVYDDLPVGAEALRRRVITQR